VWPTASTSAWIWIWMYTLQNLPVCTLVSWSDEEGLSWLPINVYLFLISFPFVSGQLRTPRTQPWWGLSLTGGFQRGCVYFICFEIFIFKCSSHPSGVGMFHRVKSLISKWSCDKSNVWMKKKIIVFHNSLTWQPGIALNIGFGVSWCLWKDCNNNSY